MRRLSLQDARRLAIMSTLLAGPRPGSLMEVAERLGRVQVDPTKVVDRAERLTLWSRCGAFDRDELRALLEVAPRQLFEYRGFLVPMHDLPLQRPAMLRYPRNDYGRGDYVGGWLRDNAAFRAYVLDEVRARGPLMTRDLDDRAEVPWQTGGWNDGKNLGRMLEILWNAGELAVSRREGTQRVWDLFERVMPEPVEELPDPMVAVELLDRQLRARGFERPGWGGALEAGELPFRDEAEESLRADGVAVPVEIDGLPGEWLAHAQSLAELDGRAWQPRTVLLGPFDPLIADRDRALRLFDFRFLLEIYKPVAKREFGYYVLAILQGDRLIGRLDPAMDRRAGVLRVNALYAEPHAPADAWPAVEAAIHELASWLGADSVELPEERPAVWI
ncbi:MAG TPA: crosslink repair DNA glycosylase YcaQ family protein [Candidatus Limnocylindria bacterium]|jgi:uncharacterized protein YcaQ